MTHTTHFIIEPSDPCPRCLTLGIIMRPRGITEVKRGKTVWQSEKVCTKCGFVARGEMVLPGINS